MFSFLSVEKLNLFLNADYEFIFLLIILAVIIITYFVYRQTNPPVSSKLRKFLLVSRVIAFLLIIFMLLEPLITFTLSKSYKPVLAVLVDTSASMKITDVELPNQSTDVEQAARIELVNKILFDPHTSLLSTLSSWYNIKLYQFSDNLSAVPYYKDTTYIFTANGQATDIGNALKETETELSESPCKGILLISDGANNKGKNPVSIAGTLNQPIYTLGIGNPKEKKDICITKLVTNEIVYALDQVPIEVTVKSSGYEKLRVPIILKEGGEVICSDHLTLSTTAREQKIVLRFTPQQEGTHRYVLSIPVQEDEKIVENNQRTFVVQVLKNKIKLLCWGTPCWDFRFLKSALQQDTNLECTFVVAHADGRYFFDTDADRIKLNQLIRSPEKIRDYDLIILVNVPPNLIPDNIFTQLNKFVADNSGALLMFCSRSDLNITAYKNTSLNEMLPVIIFHREIETIPFLIKITSTGMNHPLTKLYDDPQFNTDAWSELPPLLGCFKGIKAKTGATILAVHPHQKLPIITYHKYGSGKVLMLTGFSFWRWDMLMWGAGKSNQTYQKFFTNLTRWLVIREDIKKVRIATDKKVYFSGETINFFAQVYNENYLPIKNAEVILTITPIKSDTLIPAPEKHELMLVPRVDLTGQYEGSITGLPYGEYKYHGKVNSGSRIIGTDEGKFIVSEYGLEYENTRMDRDLLKSIASTSQGRYYESYQIKQLAEELKSDKIKLTHTYEIELWNHHIIFVLFVILVAIEWTIRKRKGLT